MPWRNLFLWSPFTLDEENETPASASTGDLSRKSEHPMRPSLQIAVDAIIKSGLSEVAYAYPLAARVGETDHEPTFRFQAKLSEISRHGSGR
jgi:hypothetical protein